MAIKNKMIEIGIEAVRSAVNDLTYNYRKNEYTQLYYKALVVIELMYDMEVIDEERYNDSLQELEENYNQAINKSK